MMQTFLFDGRFYDYKPFDLELWEQNDRAGKEVIMDYLTKNWGLDVYEGDTYGVDIVLCRQNEIVGYGEVEVRHNWQDDFPYQTVHVPYRKHKFFGYDYPTILFSIKADLREAMWCRGDVISACPLVNNPNKYMSSERFFAVPINKWKHIKLGSSWEN